MPLTTRIAYIDGKIQYGRGRAASILGQTYDVRRLTPQTDVSVSANEPVYTNFPARIRRTTDRKALENQSFELMTFVAMCDNRKLQIGDQMTETGYEAQSGGVFIFAQDRPTRETIWIRAESNVQISRIWTTSLDDSQQPDSGGVYIGNGAWSGATAEHEKMLTLYAGKYEFSTADGVTPAQIPCGLSTNARFTEGKTLDVAVEQYRDQFICYLPLLPGAVINENDRIIFGTNERYEIAKIFTTEKTGLSGYILFLIKMGF